MLCELLPREACLWFLFFSGLLKCFHQERIGLIHRSLKTALDDAPRRAAVCSSSRPRQAHRVDSSALTLLLACREKQTRDPTVRRGMPRLLHVRTLRPSFVRAVGRPLGRTATPGNTLRRVKSHCAVQMAFLSLRTGRSARGTGRHLCTPWIERVGNISGSIRKVNTV